MNLSIVPKVAAYAGGILLTLGSLVACGAADTMPVSATIDEFSTTDSMFLTECVAGNLVTEPKSYTLACGDGGQALEGLTWSDWGKAQANAVGQVTYNTCEPSCADGEFQTYDVKVAATDPVGGLYSTLTVAATGDVPAGVEQVEKFPLITATR